MSSTTATRRRPTASTAPSPFRIGKALEALRIARERLLAIEPNMPDEDRELYLDCLDGESGDAFEILDRVVRASIDAADFAVLTAGPIRRLSARKARFVRREEALREIALTMLVELGVTKIEREDFTLSLVPGQQHVVVTDLKKLAEKHPEFVRTTQEPNKVELREALKAGEQIEGAELSNPQPGLRVQTS